MLDLHCPAALCQNVSVSRCLGGGGGGEGGEGGEGGGGGGGGQNVSVSRC